LGDVEGAIDLLVDGDPVLSDDGMFGDLIDSLPPFELPEIEPIDVDAVRSCIDDVLGR
jgi:hypothetical protein